MDAEGQRREYPLSMLLHIARPPGLLRQQHCRLARFPLSFVNPPFISFMAVHPAYRKQGVGTALFRRAMEMFPHKAIVSLTTFRADDPRAAAARTLYTSFGFIPGELAMEQGYPVQVFTDQKP